MMPSEPFQQLGQKADFDDAVAKFLGKTTKCRGIDVENISENQIDDSTIQAIKKVASPILMASRLRMKVKAIHKAARVGWEKNLSNMAASYTEGLALHTALQPAVRPPCVGSCR